MNKFILSALLCGATLLSAGAKEYLVFPQPEQPGEGQENLPVTIKIWYSCEATAGQEDGKDIYTWTANEGYAGWWGGGWIIDGTKFDISELNKTNCKLVFDYKTTNTGTFNLKMEGSGTTVEKAVDITRDGKWHTATYDIRTLFPGVLESMDNGEEVSIFAPVGGGDWTDDRSISFTNIKIVEGEPYIKPIEPTYEYGAEWYGNVEKNLIVGTETYPITVSYTLTALEDGHLKVDAEMTGVEELPGHELQMHIGASWPHATKNADGTYTWISKDNEGNDATFALKDGVNPFQFWLKYEGGGLFNDDIVGYVFGASNEKPVIAIAPKLKATAEEITATSANLVYNVTLPEELAGAAVTVYLNGEKAAASPVALTDLNPSTDYSYELYAVATKDDKTYQSKTATVTFKTDRYATEPIVWHKIVDGFIPNAYLDGENAGTDRRFIPVSIETTVSYNTNSTITVDAIPHGTKKIVGLVPKITVSADGFKHEDQVMTVKEDGSWTYTTPDKCAEGLEFPWLNFRPAYDGGDCNIEIKGYKAGAEQAAEEYGAAADVFFDFPKTELLFEETVDFKAVVVDGNRHFLPDEKMKAVFYKDVNTDHDVKNETLFEIENGKIKAVGHGSDELVVIYDGNKEAKQYFACLTNKDGINLHTTAKVSSTTDATMDFTAAFDNNEETQIDFGKASAEHNLTLDLGQSYYIQAVQLVWEGASAKDYTVTLTNTTDTPNTENGVAAYADTEHVFTVKDGEGGAGMTVRKNLHTDDMSSIPANKVELNTTAAATPWGIKLKEMKVLGSLNKVETLPTEVSEVNAEQNGLVDVYNLQGVLVLKNVTVGEIINLPRGIYVAGGHKYFVK